MSDDLDLTNEPVEVTQEISPPTTRAFNVEQAREWTRIVCVGGLLLIMAATIWCLYDLVVMDKLEGQVLGQTVFPTLATLVSAALAFYFGTKDRA